MKLGPIEINWKQKKSFAELSTIVAREKSDGLISLKIDPKSQLEAYKSWVYSCVSIIKDRFSSLPYGFYNKDTGEQLSTKNKGYKIFSKPFTHPNDLMTFRFIKEFCQMQLDLCGTACIYKALNKLGQVWELWPLNMNDFMKVEVTGDLLNPSVKYVFKSGNNNYIDFDISELIVIYYTHPTKMFIGASPVQSQAYSTDIDTYIEVYERDFFKNSARVDFALVTEAQIDQQKADELKERWLSKFQGRFHDVAVLDSGLKPVPLQYTNRDFEFLDLANWSKEKILGCYRVPANKLGSTDSNRAGSVYSDISFNREAIQPRVTLWDEEMTEYVCATYDERLSIRHQNPIPRDRQIELQEAKSYCGVPTLTINEFREQYHKKSPVDGGDRIVVPQGFLYLDKLDEYSDNIIAGKPPTDDSDRDRDGEAPHVNPDGTDDRDDSPTDGRNLIPMEIKKKSFNEFFSLINKSRPVWNELIFNALKDVEYNDFEKQLKGTLIETLSATVDVLINYYDIDYPIEVTGNDWILPIAEKTTIEYLKTLYKNPKWKELNWKNYFKEQFDSNPRLSKILNALLKSCINYTKWLILNSKKDVNIEWIVHSNECGHKGRIDKAVTSDKFKIGITNIRFPGELALAFSCDCTITNKETI